MNTILLYIDPGTGSMLFSLVIGLVATAVFGLRALAIKLKFGLGKKDTVAADTIPYVIFSDNKRYWNVFRGICEEFDKKGIDVVYYTLSKDDPVFNCNLGHIHPEFLGEGNKPYSRLNFLKADIVLSTTPGLDVYQWKRSRDVKCYVHIPHSVDDLSTYRMFGLDHYDVLLAAGINQVETQEKLEALRPAIKKKEKVIVGSTYMDCLLEKLPQYTKEEHERKVVLVAPSWGKTAILSKFGDSLLSALEKTGYEIIVRPHPQSFSSEMDILQPLMDKYKDIEWNRDNDNFSVLARADILISDFSSVVFDYTLVFRRPIIYADVAFDSIVYDQDWLSEECWPIRMLPKLGTKLEEKDFERIGEVIEEALLSKSIEDGIKEVTFLCWSTPGESAKNASEYLIEKRAQLTAEKKPETTAEKKRKKR